MRRAFGWNPARVFGLKPIRTIDGRIGSLAAAAAVLVAGDLLAGAPGTIDTDGAILATGQSPSPGTVVVEESADLGAAPSMSADGTAVGSNGFPRYAWEFYGYDDPPDSAHRGLGGPDYTVDSDVTFPGGTYDFDSLTVGPGATLRFTGPTTLRLTGDARIDGRVAIEGTGAFTLDCRGSLTMVGGTSALQTGIVTEDDAAIVLVVGGRLDVAAENGSYVLFSARGTSGDLEIVSGGDASLMRATFETGRPHDSGGSEKRRTHTGHVRGGAAVLLQDCVATGTRLLVTSAVGRRDENGMFVSSHLTVRGGTYRNATFHGGDVEITSGAEITGGDYVWILGSAATISGGATLTAAKSVGIRVDRGAEVTDGAVLRVVGGSGPVNFWDAQLFVVAGGSFSLGTGSRVENATAGPLVLIAEQSMTLSGRVRGQGTPTELTAWGDIEIADDADVDATTGPMRLWAGGAIFATGGRARLSATEYDVRCVTGDLDLDVETMDATSGRLIALSNGLVRLRGTYRAARDVQVLSLLDSVDVRGATLETLDAGASPSGFVRLVTFAPAAVVLPIPADGDDDWSDEDEDEEGEDTAKRAASRTGETGDEAVAIDATGAALRTGASQVRSGDVLVQVAASADEATVAKMKSVRARARRTPGGVTTQVRGVLAFAGARPNLSGSTRVTAGSVSRRLYLTDATAVAADGPSGSLSFRYARRSSARRAPFLVEVTEPTAQPGQIVRLGFDRAGIHARTTFRRPKAR